MSKPNQIHVPAILSDAANRLLTDYKNIITSTDTGKKKIVKPEIEELLKEFGPAAVIGGKKELIEYHRSFLVESKINFDYPDEKLYLAEVDEYYHHREQIIFLVADIADLLGLTRKMDFDDSLFEELNFILEKDSIKATGTIERSVCGTGDLSGDAYEVCNYLRVKTEGGGEITLFEDDLKQLLDVVQTANRQTAGRFSV